MIARQYQSQQSDDGDDDSDEETELKHTMSPIDVSQGDESDTNSKFEESSCSDSESTASSVPLLESAENDVDMSDDEEFRPDPVNSRTKRSTADYKRNYTDQLLLHVDTLLATTDEVTYELTPLSLKQALLSKSHERWIQAMKDEMESLNINTWSEISLVPNGRQCVGTKSMNF